ncbi:tRNA(Arg) A34 adenosine deaminase TadA [Pseudovibrio denitrificans]|uniref:tRNA(Arg) A34 adenosine deaminase TadA n=1 Tax=Pseudovibrio denitrificans TaxID=258256 RepID=A0A1I7CQT5_9HYPH|nr:nucleoside deaminase [Pseudovibrio denitrificans]SFU01775.1 tRNA(Arg) A34 adenosine deaminase TadA [Pseudovibrio denitrificans]
MTESELELHHQRMRELITFTATSLETPYPSPFGCAVYSAEGELLAQAYDSVIKECDPTCHGEINAIRLASEASKARSFPGGILYSTCEPCAMCMAATIWAGFDTLVFGAYTNEDATNFWPQEMSLRAKDLAASMVQRPEIAIFEGVERQACQQLFTDYGRALKRLGIRI